MTKIWSSEIFVDENQKFLFFGKFSMESENFSKIGGNLKQREMHNCLRRVDAPAYVFESACGVQFLRLKKIDGLAQLRSLRRTLRRSLGLNSDRPYLDAAFSEQSLGLS